MRFWRLAVAVSLIAFAVRGITPAYDALPPIAWPLLQAGPLALLGVSGVLIRKTPIRLDAVDVSMVLLLIAAAASTSRMLVPSDGLWSVAQLGLLFLFLFSTRSARWSDPAVMRADLRWFGWVLVGIHFAGLAAFYVGQPWAVSFNDRYQGTWFNPNYAGISAALAALLLLSVRRRAVDVAGALVVLYAVLASGSRGALVAAVVGLIVLAVAPASRGRMLVYGWATSVLLVASALFNLGLTNWITDFYDRVRSASDPTSGRLDIYAVFWARWQESPILGTGFGTGRVVRLNADQEAVTLLGHNIYLTALVEMGVVGLLALLGVLFAIWRKSRRRDPLLATLLAVVVFELTESTMLGAGNPVILTVWLCLIGCASTRPTEERVEAGVSRSRTSRQRVTSGSRPATG